MSIFNELYSFMQDSRPNDVLFDQQWSLFNDGKAGGIAGLDVNALGAWSIANTSPDVVVAVIDTGIQLDHPDLEDNIWFNQNEIPGNGLDDDDNGYKDDITGWNFGGYGSLAGGSPDPYVPDGDYISHGTHVAGIIGATGDNDIGIAGVTWDVQIMPLEANLALPTKGQDGPPIYDPKYDYFGKAIRYAVDNGASVINISQGIMGYGQSYDEWKEENPIYHEWRFDPIKYAVDNGVSVVICAGNSPREIGANNTIMPGIYSEMLDGVISVGAITNTGKPTKYTNWGEFVDISAPGGEKPEVMDVQPLGGEEENSPLGILSTNKNDNYASLYGTSQSAPIVTGAIALMLDIDPSLTPAKIEQILEESATTSQLLFEEGLGDGLILDIEAALRMTSELLEASTFRPYLHFGSSNQQRHSAQA